MSPARSRFAASARPRLAAVVNGALVGWVYRAGDRRLGFRYEQSWQEDPLAYPLSISMPLAVAEHGHRAASAYLWGLLPENPAVLAAWAREYRVSSTDVVGLLANVGEDCAGAIQFAALERVPALLGSTASADEASDIAWLSDDELEERLRAVRLDPAAGRGALDTGHFSLPGVQSKIALYESHEGRWGIPSGRVPTNRIVKPPIPNLQNVVQNEHICLELARALGLTAAVSRVLRVGAEIAIAVERYDRLDRGGALVRVHQEDLCQALAVQPTKKYEWDGGPGVVRTVQLLRDVSTEPELDVQRFLDAVIFNWLIAGTDAHAKNYSLLHAPGRQLRLAPLYDLISALPYPQLERGRPSLAMGVGGERQISSITREHWLVLANEVGIPPATLLERAKSLASAVPTAMLSVAAHIAAKEPDSHVVTRLAELIESRAEQCSAVLG